MPYLEVIVYGGPVPTEAKGRLFRRLTQATVEALGVAPAQVRVGLQQWPAPDGFRGGQDRPAASGKGTTSHG